MNSIIRPRRLFVSGGSRLSADAASLWRELWRPLTMEDGLVVITGGPGPGLRLERFKEHLVKTTNLLGDHRRMAREDRLPIASYQLPQDRYRGEPVAQARQTAAGIGIASCWI